MRPIPGFPSPHTSVPLACRTNPTRFVHEHGPSSKDDIARIERAKAACHGWPIAADCLKWALANRELAPSGFWAATTARQRTTLRWDGAWVGEAASPDAISDLIDTYENGGDQ